MKAEQIPGCASMVLRCGGRDHGAGGIHVDGTTTTGRAERWASRWLVADRPRPRVLTTMRSAAAPLAPFTRPSAIVSASTTRQRGARPPRRSGSTHGPRSWDSRSRRQRCIVSNEKSLISSWLGVRTWTTDTSAPSAHAISAVHSTARSEPAEPSDPTTIRLSGRLASDAALAATGSCSTSVTVITSPKDYRVTI